MNTVFADTFFRIAFTNVQDNLAGECGFGYGTGVN
jgi:hypothetical protein